MKLGPKVKPLKALALVVVCSLPPGWAQAADSQASGIGPFRFGMSFADARAAAPRAKWAETLSRYTDKPVELDGRNALRIGGLSFDVNLRPLAHGGYRVRIVYAEDGARASQKRCLEALAMVADNLEVRFGALVPMTPLSDSEDGGLPVGFQTLADSGDSTIMGVGNGSHAQVFKPERTGTTMWLMGQRREDLNIVAGARFLDQTSPLWPSTCVVTAQLTSLPPRPAFDLLDLSSMPSAPTPSIPSRRRSFSGLPTLPSKAAKVEISCKVSRLSGNVSECRAADGSDARLAKAAERQGDDLAFSPTVLDPDSDIPLRLRAVLLIDPADSRPFTLPSGVTLLKMNEVAWAKRPRGEDIAPLYPDRAMRMGLAARLSLLCQIVADGSLMCADVTVDTAPGQEATFEGLGDKISGLFRAETKLINGEAAVGRWVQMTFALNPG